jgi:hypothetical protein
LTVQQAFPVGSYAFKEPRRVFSGWKAWALAACCLLFAAALSFLAFSQFRRLRLESDQARVASLEWQQRYNEQQQSAIAAEEQHQQTERELANQVHQLTEDLQNVRTQPPAVGSGLRGRTHPIINLPIFVLKSDRGTDRASPDSSAVSLPRSAADFVMSIPLEADARQRTYQVTIFAGDRPFWQSSGLRPDRYNALTIGFSSSFFPPGKYLLVVNAITNGEPQSRSANYPFRVIR